MIKFVNAKINIGLQIVERRQDGYHNLQTIFYPVGLYAGTPENPVEFCDILEVVATDGDAPYTLVLKGKPVNCPPEKNLVWRAARLFFENGVPDGFKALITLDKHLPDGAGLGGGSADASFTLMALAEVAKEYAEVNRRQWECPTRQRLAEMALELGADCPFFIYNRPAYAEGVGERLTPVDLDLRGYWIVIAKPVDSVSTKEAFAGVAPAFADLDLSKLAVSPVDKWRDMGVNNDFEKSIFPQFPDIAVLKEAMYDNNALYASLTGSGACVYGLFDNKETAQSALAELQPLPTIRATYLLKL